MKKVMHYAAPLKWIIAAVLLLKLAGAVMDLLIPATLGDIIDVAVPTGEKKVIYAYGVKMLIFAVLAFTCNLSANMTTSYVSAKIVQNLRQDLFVKVTNLSARQMDSLTVSSAVSRLTSDTYNIMNLFNRCLRIGVRAPILMVGGIMVTLFMDPVLTIMLIIALPLISLVVVSLTKRTIPMYAERQTILDRMIRTVQENVTGIRVIKALSKSEYEKNRYDKVNGELADKNFRAGLTMALSRPATTLILNLSLVCVVVLGAFRVNGGLMLPGKIIAFINYFTIILNATLGITGIFTVYSNGSASAERVAGVLDTEDAMTLVDVAAEDSDNYIEFRHVDFSYNGVEKNLTDVSFALKKGQTLGIIGATGSGKTTILNLLLRFYDVDSGEIRIGGRDIRAIPDDELRSLFGVAFQNDFLVADSIAANISYFRDLSEKDVTRAVKLAQAEAFVAEKGGTDALLTVRGNNLSGGQKQRLLIARALAANPQILVLDDSSSALDYRTDAGLRRALAENFPDTTKIIVAQRVSSIRSADLILVVENGEIIGKGTDAELMESCEDYREIARIQMDTEEVAVHA